MREPHPSSCRARGDGWQVRMIDSRLSPKLCSSRLLLVSMPGGDLHVERRSSAPTY